MFRDGREKYAADMKSIEEALNEYIERPGNQDMTYSFHEIRIVK